ncbi:MAG: hypothetical protein U5N58_04575 [Actinomycetota bacterium]|nr:hypothetical protein [Actinomycetota bacterium]
MSSGKKLDQEEGVILHDLKFAVVGAGHGGKAIAAHLAIKGFDVNLYNRTLVQYKYLS